MKDTPDAADGDALARAGGSHFGKLQERIVGVRETALGRQAGDGGGGQGNWGGEWGQPELRDFCLVEDLQESVN